MCRCQSLSLNVFTPSHWLTDWLGWRLISGSWVRHHTTDYSDQCGGRQRNIPSIPNITQGSLPLTPKRQHKHKSTSCHAYSRYILGVLYLFSCSFSFLLNKKPHHLSGYPSRIQSFIAGWFDLPAIIVFWFDFTIQGEGERILNSLIFWALFLFLSVHFSFYKRIILSSSWHWHHPSDKNGAILQASKLSVSRKLMEDTPSSIFELKIAPFSSPFHNK